MNNASNIIRMTNCDCCGNDFESFKLLSINNDIEDSFESYVCAGCSISEHISEGCVIICSDGRRFESVEDYYDDMVGDCEDE